MGGGGYVPLIVFFNILYLLIIDTGGSYSLMAWTGMVGNSSMIITFFALPRINDRIGHIPVLVAACFAVGVGSAVCGVISNPVWMIIPNFLRGR